MLKFFARNDSLDGRIPNFPKHWDRESYIPVDPRDLVAWIARKAEVSPSKFGCFLQISDALRQIYHAEFRKLHDRITHAYRLVDPDSDIISNDHDDRGSSESEVSLPIKPSERFNLDNDIEELLVRANYRRLNPHEIQSAMRTASYWGVRLRVRLSMFQRLRVYGRGDIIGRKNRRRWSRAYRLEEVEVPIYKRLVLLFRVKPSQTFHESLHPKNLHLRMFKNIPKLDVDMLLPAAGVKMTWLDTGKIGIPTAWGFSMLIFKLMKSISMLAVLGAWRFLSSFILVTAVMIASVVYGVRSFISYLTAKRRYLLNVAQNLYYQNLDNNLGVVLRLLEEAEQQEVCEAIIAYYVLFRSLSEEGISTETLDHQCEQLILEYTGFDIDFEVQDVLRDLLEMKIIQGADGGYRVVPHQEAVRVLLNRN